jgi:hypothetical protein
MSCFADQRGETQQHRFHQTLVLDKPLAISERLPNLGKMSIPTRTF